MAPPGELRNPVVGEFFKVSLPGESPWALCVDINDDGSWNGEIASELVCSALGPERRQEASLRLGVRLKAQHFYKFGDIVRFVRMVDPEFEIWVPAAGRGE
jgi:hypothetical protein